jgi:thioredoxin 1
MVAQLNKTNFKQEVELSKKPVVIDVFASWCGPCIHMMPIFEEIAEELSTKYNFVKLNVDEARDLAIHYGVTSVPTFLFVKNNQVKGTAVGSMTKDDLKAKIEQLLG